MKSVIKNLITSLNKIGWDSKSIAHEKVEFLLNDLKANLNRFQIELENLSDNYLRNLAELSVETPTHFKWFLYENQMLNYKIWLHEYKSRIEKGAGYAIVPHNHRYWFTSFIIRGGFTNSIYQVEKLNKKTIDRYLLVDEQSFEEGKIYSFSSDIIHSLSNIKEPTVTLIIQSKALKNFSESYDFQSKKVQRHYSFAARLEKFKQLIKSI
jgi:hypothetical protein